MIKHITISPMDALEKLKEGNKKYISSIYNTSDISQLKRADALANGQAPYAIIITCSDSRAIPENIFMTGIGELFVIRMNEKEYEKEIEYSLEIQEVEHLEGLKVIGAM